MDKLFIFVEGSDDERFFRHYYSGRNVKMVQYANMPSKEFSSYIQTITHMNAADYIIVADSDGASIDDKKRKIIEKHPICNISKVFISQREIESWYIAGLNRCDSAKYRVKYIFCTDNISKEKFDLLIPKGYTPTSFKVEILKFYDFEEAKYRNASFKIFANA